MRSLCPVMALMLLAGLAHGGSFTLPLKVDTYVDRDDPSSSFGEEGMMRVASISGEPARIGYMLYGNNFDDIGVLTPEQIDSAKLTIYVSEVETGGIVMVYFTNENATALDTWTWSDRVDFDNATYSEIPIGGTGEYTTDATDIVRMARKSCPDVCPFTFVLVADGNTSVAFATKESSQGSAKLEYSSGD